MRSIGNSIGRRRLLTAGALGTGAAAATLLTSAPAGANSPTPRVATWTDEPPDGNRLPLRAFDSRTWPAIQGGGVFKAGQTRTVITHASVQGLSADHVFITVTVFGATGQGYLTVYPADRTDLPMTSTISWGRNTGTVSAGLLTRCQVVALTGRSHQSRIKIHFAGTGEAQVIVDLTATLGGQLY